jgi:rRNA-processing protein FCF1
LIISTRVEGEAINRLQKAPYNYDREQAKEMVGKVITHLNLHREFKEDVDDKNGNELIKKYRNTNADCHYPDSTIIAHLKRIRVDVVITRDKNFREVAEKEGLKVHYIPTKESIIGRRVSQLFRGRH